MSTVRDPAFWRRFSVAVHRDEEAQMQAVSRPELKHSYVETQSPSPMLSLHPESRIEISQTQDLSISPFSSPPATPLELPYTIATPRPQNSRTPSSILPLLSPALPAPVYSPSPSSPDTSPPDPKRTPSVLRKSPKPPKPSTFRSSIHSLSRRNPSTLTLGLSGRPASRGFRFWTSITADPSHRESWLEEQRRKKSKRTLMCWCFWGVFTVLVAGIVIAILLLKGAKII